MRLSKDFGNADEVTAFGLQNLIVHADKSSSFHEGQCSDQVWSYHELP